MPLAELLGYRAAQLWLQGYRLRRAGRFAATADRKRRARFEAAAARYRVDG